MKRDTQLDAYRAILMAYIVCFIHVEFWLGFGKEPWMSLSLVEMPLIFFVSGAALSFHREPRPFWTTVRNRAKRILLPYYIYALLMLGIVACRQGLADYTLKDWLFVATCHDIKYLPFAYHLWFIPIYMILSCTFDLQKRILTKIKRGGGYICLCVAAFWIVCQITRQGWIRDIFCYNIFMVVGYAYYRKANLKIILLSGCLSLVLLLSSLAFNVSFCPMQGHKFPPDMVFLSYNMLVLCGLSLLLRYVKLPDCRILRFWNTNGFNIYLYQNIPYWFVAFALHHGFAPSGRLTQMLFSVIALLCLSTMMFYAYRVGKRCLMWVYRHIIE